uniref:Threonine aspartase n=1 Tax=Acrobeloides nanus TaxID=290746 RepID=A0A914D1N6_9BILA
MIAVHAGAGYHEDDIEKLCASALRESGFDIVRAVMILESDARTNCGLGSNLTISGRVECEAAYMISQNLSFGAVAAVSNTENPVFAAKKIVEEQIEKGSASSLVQPMVLAGYGADRFVENLGLQICANEELVTDLASKDYEKALRNLAEMAKMRMDTVGAVSIEPSGLSKSCVSSGGILLKRDGRLGHSPQFGSAIWSEQRGTKSISISVSGCGEALTRVHFAQNLAEKILDWDDSNSLLMVLVRDFFEKHFRNSRLLEGFSSDRILAGGIVLFKDGSINELVVFHNTQHFAFACSNGKSIRRYKSSLPAGSALVCNSFGC